MPKTKTDEIIKLTLLFETLFGQYKVGPCSYPHVTISQFYHEGDEIISIWDKIINEFGNINLKLTFERLSFISFNEKDFWVSLIPDNIDYLHGINKKISSILNLKQKREYDPHLTLFSTKDRSCESINKNIKIPTIADDFYLAIGVCDELGQFTQIITSEFI